MKYLKTRLYKYPNEYICTIKRIKKDYMQIIDQNNEYTAESFSKKIGVLVLKYSKESRVKKKLFIESWNCPELDKEADNYTLYLRGSSDEKDLDLIDIERLLFNKRKHIVK